MATDSELASLYERLVAIESLSNFDDDAALQRLGWLIDLSLTFDREDGTEKALAWCDELERRPLSGANVPLLDYFRANAWANREKPSQQNAGSAWSWDQPERSQQILSLRHAVHRPQFSQWASFRRAQVFTNLANQLNSLGRFVEALPLWRRALLAHPKFGMALGNRGLGLSEYARSLYDRGHQSLFLVFAHADLSEAVSEAAQYEENFDNDGAKAAFAARKAQIEAVINVSETTEQFRLDGHPLGDSTEEQHYRRWVLEEGLFLNPLNDLGPHSISAHDIFNLPDFTTEVGEPPTLIGLFNQMKQEYVSARWMLYDGINTTATHFSDRDVALYNTLDYPSYSVAVEKVKAAYRIAYALFDKIAFFLNDYMNLGIDLNNVYFRRIWYRNQDAVNGAIRVELANLSNWPWRGLFWLAKDLFDPALRDSSEPDAQQLYFIRNCLEHRYLKVHEFLVHRIGDNDLWHDRLAYSVQREDFFRKTLNVLRLSRAALIYLSLGMHSEETRRLEERDHRHLMSMPLHLWPDDWKF